MGVKKIRQVERARFFQVNHQMEKMGNQHRNHGKVIMFVHLTMRSSHSLCSFGRHKQRGAT